MPASTDVDNILRQFQKAQSNQLEGMTVVFSTYQSIEVIAAAQSKIISETGKGVFDLIICDEAHRTTGVTLADSDESAFVKVHDNDFIQAKKRLYMTATPRLYSDESKSKAAQTDAVLCSMDDIDMIVQDIKLRRTYLHNMAVRSFRRGQKAKFFNKGTYIQGTVTKVAQKYVTLDTGTTRWRVPAGHLEKVA